MVDTPKMLKCNHCKRTVTEHAMPKHIERCLNKKQEKQRKKKEAKDARDAAARKEKGQESDEEEDGERSAVKGEAKAKASKPKAPVDVERQCGVELPQGGQCARSLTCKSHSMGAKRAVAGRSAPYDKLLMEYQRKNAARQQKAAFDANAPDPEDDAVPSGPIDEQAETDQFMAAIAQNWGGAPLVPKRPAPLARKYDRIRIKDMIASAGSNLFKPAGTTGGGGGGFFGQPREATDDEPGPLHARKTSAAPGARSMIPPASRKASVASAIGA
jgi:SAGA-associated factor 73